MKKPVITGMGVSGAGYPNLESLVDLLRNSRSSIGKHYLFPDCHFPSAQIGAIIPAIDLTVDLRDYPIDKQFLTHAQTYGKRRGLVYQSAASAAIQAWFQAGMFDKVYNSDEIAIIVAGEHLNLDKQLEAHLRFEDSSSVSATYAQQFLDSTVMSYLSEIFNIRGAGFDVSGATASGNIAIMQAVKLLDKRIKCCMVVGALAAMTSLEIQGFYKSKALGGDSWLCEPQKASRPFDLAHEGFIYGQGAGCIIIEDEESALFRERQPLARILGAAMCLDANSSMQPSLAGEIKVLHKVIETAQIDKIDYINAHGTSTPLGDEVEAEAIDLVFQGEPWVNATKGLIGHTMWAAAIIECIASIIQINESFLHGNINLDNPINTNLRFVGKSSMEHNFNTALSLSFGFGGINSALILKKYK